MKENNYITKKESNILKILFALTLLFTIYSISLKFIKGYNWAIKEEQFHLLTAANNSGSFNISDCYYFYNHPALFALFSVSIFLYSLSIKKFTKTSYFSLISFCFLLLSLLQATYLHIWFVEIVKIKWNSILILSDIFDAVLYFCFASILILQFKIIYRFTREKFQAKLSLK